MQADNFLTSIDVRLVFKKILSFNVFNALSGRYKKN